MYQRKTSDVYEIYTKYPEGWELVTQATTWEEAKALRKDYDKNESKYIHKIVMKREKL